MVHVIYESESRILSNPYILSTYILNFTLSTSMCLSFHAKWIVFRHVIFRPSSKFSNKLANRLFQAWSGWKLSAPNAFSYSRFNSLLCNESFFFLFFQWMPLYVACGFSPLRGHSIITFDANKSTFIFIRELKTSFY